MFYENLSSTILFCLFFLRWNIDFPFLVVVSLCVACPVIIFLYSSYFLVFWTFLLIFPRSPIASVFLVLSGSTILSIALSMISFVCFAISLERNIYLRVCFLLVQLNIYLFCAHSISWELDIINFMWKGFSCRNRKSNIYCIRSSIFYF